MKVIALRNPDDLRTEADRQRRILEKIQFHNTLLNRVQEQRLLSKYSDQARYQKMLQAIEYLIIGQRSEMKADLMRKGRSE